MVRWECRFHRVHSYLAALHHRVEYLILLVKMFALRGYCTFVDVEMRTINCLMFRRLRRDPRHFYVACARHYRVQSEPCIRSAKTGINRCRRLQIFFIQSLSMHRAKRRLLWLSRRLFDDYGRERNLNGDEVSRRSGFSESKLIADDDITTTRRTAQKGANRNSLQSHNSEPARN